MGWEQRGNNQYFYKKEREGSRVKSVYVGRSKIAQMVAQIHSSSGIIEKYARKMKLPQAIEQEKVEAALDQLTDRIRVMSWRSTPRLNFASHTQRKRVYIGIVG